MKQAGKFTSEVISLLGLTVAEGTPIFIGETNIEHIIESHPRDYRLYGDQINEIIKAADYVGRHPNDAFCQGTFSIKFIFGVLNKHLTFSRGENATAIWR
ncbi:hypothetical protein FACS1894202_12430 [Clostridia bacterium]|nr:hypothetical protein FACS1894202_12430 [Clostridia bacterium]